MDKDQIVGAVVGFATGDALGMANEFGNNKVYRFEDNPKKNLNKGQWTDDTQFFMLASDSLLHVKTVDPYDIASRLKKLYASGEIRSLGYNTGSAIQNLLNKVPLSKSGARGQYSCGAGGLSRLLPYTLMDSKLPRSEVKSILKMTHNNKDLFKVADGLVDFIELLKTEKSINLTVEDLKSYFPGRLRSSFNAYDSRGYAPGLISAAMQSFVKHPRDFRAAVIDSVNHLGDSDTRTSLVGFFSGLYNGINRIPTEFVSGLEAKDTLVSYGHRISGVSYVRN